MVGIIKESIEYYGISDSFPENPNCFKELTIQDKLVNPNIKPDIEQVIKVIAEIEITETRIIKTPISKSFEGNILTGWKLIVQGVLREKIEYVAAELAEPVHATQFRCPFSTYIVLPKNFREGEKINVNGYIEDIHIHQIGSKELFNSVDLFLEATYSCL